MRIQHKNLLLIRASVVSSMLVCASMDAAPTSHDDDLSEIQAGGRGGAFYRGSDGFSVPMTTSSARHIKSFVMGKSLFKENWVSSPASVRNRQGLGPIFNAQSCSTCHFKDGRGQPPETPSEPMVSMLVRLSIPGASDQGGVVPEPRYGDQFNHRSNVGVRSEGDVFISFTEEKHTYPDGTPYGLLTPHYEFKNLNFGPMAKGVLISGRVAPQVFGLGLLEAIPEAAILANANSSRADGISGKANWVWDVKAGKKRLGRFGWKSNQPSILQQNAGALLGDMGVTSSLFAHQNCVADARDCLDAPTLPTTEIDERDLSDMEAYVKLVAVPVRRNLKDPDVKIGQAQFISAGCPSCHIPSFVTGVDPKFPEVSRQRIFPYTDLLVHDMGEGLADNRPDFDANGREWRTPPLWGIGLIPEVNGHTRLLHDGRARSIEEAILWHGGEAESSKRSFMSMSQELRKQLIKFVESL